MFKSNMKEVMPIKVVWLQNVFQKIHPSEDEWSDDDVARYALSVHRIPDDILLWHKQQNVDVMRRGRSTGDTKAADGSAIFKISVGYAFDCPTKFSLFCQKFVDEQTS